MSARLIRLPVWIALACWILGPVRVSAEIQRLAAWRFESGDLAAEDGSVPRLRSGGTVVPGAVGKGIEFRSAGGSLVYPPAGKAGRSNVAIDPLAMSVGFYYRPNWTSPGEGGGKGPGETAVLMAIGDRERSPGDGWWELSMSADGTRILLAYGSGGREVVELSSQPVRLKEGFWSDLRLAIFPGRVRLHCDGTLVMVESPRKVSGPGPVALRKGIVFGSRPNGSLPARGALDEIEIHDAPLERIEAYKSGRVMSARSLTNGVGLDLQWRCRPSALMELQRADEGSTNWASLASRIGLMAYRDATIQPGRRYQYRVLTNDRPCELTFTGGVRLPPIEDRGGILVLVDQTLAGGLEPDLVRWERDVRSDGWRVRRETVARHDDREWRNNTNAIAAIRELVRGEWKSSGRTLRCVFLVGHVAVPYSGIAAEDLHTRPGDNHYGAWPSDQYYADMDGLWTDKEPYPNYLPEATHPANRNVPGDGKFDERWVPPNARGDTRLELAFARVDFANMPAFGRGTSGELRLLKDYFAKVGKYRAGRTPASPRVVVGNYFENGTDFDLLPAAYRTGSRLYGYEPSDIFQGDLFDLGTETAAWGFQSGAGKIDRIRDGSPSMVTSAQLASGARQPRVLFAMLLGSWFGDWAVGENNLLRGVLASKDYGLAAFWVRYTEWRFDSLSWGGTLADAQWETANEVIQWQNPNRGTTRTLTILGDPTLRLLPTPAPTNLRGRTSDRGVTLTWDPPGRSSAVRFWVYRTPGGEGDAAGREVRLTEAPLGAREFLDPAPVPGAAYRVKAVELIETASGSYTNLSLAAEWPAPVGP